MIDISYGADSLYALSVELEEVHTRLGNEIIKGAIIDSNIKELQMKKDSCVRAKQDLESKESAIKSAMARIIHLDRMDKIANLYRN